MQNKNLHLTKVMSAAQSPSATHRVLYGVGEHLRVGELQRHRKTTEYSRNPAA